MAKIILSGPSCLLEGKYHEGIQVMNQAIAMENEHAESYFWLGRLLEADGQKAAAWGAFSKARDLDYNPFRLSAVSMIQFGSWPGRTSVKAFTCWI